jgi:hypothetical protein
VSEHTELQELSGWSCFILSYHQQDDTPVTPVNYIIDNTMQVTKKTFECMSTAIR